VGLHAGALRKAAVVAQASHDEIGGLRTVHACGHSLGVRGPFLTSPLGANFDPPGANLSPRGELIPWG
jgi:hypothetical protein